jgi:hypothetical protein
MAIFFNPVLADLNRDGRYAISEGCQELIFPRPFVFLQALEFFLVQFRLGRMTSISSGPFPAFVLSAPFVTALSESRRIPHTGKDTPMRTGRQGTLDHDEKLAPPFDKPTTENKRNRTATRSGHETFPSLQPLVEATYASVIADH